MDYIIPNLVPALVGLVAGILLGVVVIRWFNSRRNQRYEEYDQDFYDEKPKRKNKNDEGQSALEAARLRISEDGELIPVDEWEAHQNQDEKPKNTDLDAIGNWPVAERTIPRFPAVSNEIPRPFVRRPNDDRGLQFIELTTAEKHALEAQEAAEELHYSVSAGDTGWTPTEHEPAASVSSIDTSHGALLAVMQLEKDIRSKRLSETLAVMNIENDLRKRRLAEMEQVAQAQAEARLSEVAKINQLYSRMPQPHQNASHTKVTK